MNIELIRMALKANRPTLIHRTLVRLEIFMSNATELSLTVYTTRGAGALYFYHLSEIELYNVHGDPLPPLDEVDLVALKKALADYAEVSHVDDFEHYHEDEIDFRETSHRE
jgi:hypothetical protein